MSWWEAAGGVNGLGEGGVEQSMESTGGAVITLLPSYGSMTHV